MQRGGIKPIQVSMQDRQGGRKHITRIVHVESFAIDPGTASPSTIKSPQCNVALIISCNATANADIPICHIFKFATKAQHCWRTAGHVIHFQ